MNRVAHLLSSLTFIAVAAPSVRGQCGSWSNQFQAGLALLRSRAFASFQNELFIFGDSATVSPRVFLRYDGSTLRRAGTAPNGDVMDALAFDDGSGAKLYIVGAFTFPGGLVARFDGSSWISMPGLSGIPAYGATLLAHDDGSGPALYAGGKFTAPTPNIARWNGSSWSALAGGTDAEVRALARFDDGSGPKLYAGGEFTNAGGTSAAFAARWDGALWTSLGSGPGAAVFDLAAFDDGSGAALYACVASANRVMRWNGSSWSVANSGLTAMPWALAVHDDGSGLALYASNGVGASGRAGRWNGTTWVELFPLLTEARLVASHGNTLYFGGQPTFDAVGSGGFVAWNGVQLRVVGGGIGANAYVRALATHDDGSGLALYAGGDYSAVGGVPAGRVARWNGTIWSAVGNGLAGAAGGSYFVGALAEFDAGGGADLYASGQISTTPTFANDKVARWDGASWTPVPGAPSSVVHAMKAFDDGSGPALYIAGDIGVNENIARWNGTSWSSIGAVGGFSSAEVYALEVFDDGSGPKLYAGGYFSQAGSAAATNVARWDGTTWSALGGGLGGGFPQYVYSLATHDDGSGLALYAGGGFVVGGTAGIARWNGSAWSAVGAGTGQYARALLSHDDGTGRALYAAGNYNVSVKRWDGATWTALSPLLSHTASTLASFDAGTGPTLFVGGTFDQMDGTTSSGIASLSSTAVGGLYCTGDGSWTSCPCGNQSTAAERAGCANSLGSGGALRASGCPSVTGDSVVLAGHGMPDAAALYFQGTSATDLGAGAVFGDGLRCSGGSMIRLATLANTAGASALPNPSFPTPISVLGALPAAGGTRFYQVWYRNAAAFCSASTFNLTNGVRVAWRV